MKAGGAVFVSLETGRILLVMRSHTVSHPHTWCFPGGKIEANETVMQGISREIKEEIGFIPKYMKAIPIDVFKSLDGEFIFYSIAVFIEDEFIPNLNNENLGYGWFDIECLPKPLITGARKTLMHKDFKKSFKQMIKDHTV